MITIITVLFVLVVSSVGKFASQIYWSLAHSKTNVTRLRYFETIYRRGCTKRREKRRETHRDEQSFCDKPKQINKCSANKSVNLNQNLFRLSQILRHLHIHTIHIHASKICQVCPMYHQF